MSEAMKELCPACDLIHPFCICEPKETTMVEQRLLFSIPQTAEALAVSRSTIYRLINDGAIESIMVRGIQRIRPSALQRYLDNQERLRQREL